jgi:hypothetical protein
MKVVEMPVYENCTVTTYEGNRSYRSTCDVNFQDDSIAVSYQDDGGAVVYQGRQIAPGHFNLTSTTRNGRATLHQVPNENVLEGWWLEGGYEGM